MARPIKETPILTGKDAELFVEEMQNVEKMSKETRAENKNKLRNAFEQAVKRISGMPLIFKMLFLHQSL